MSHVGHTVKEIVKKRGLTQDDFSARMGITRAYLVRLFDKSEWPDKYTNKAIEILGVKIDKSEYTNDTHNQSTSESQIEYLKQVIEAKDEVIASLKDQIELLKSTSK